MQRILTELTALSILPVFQAANYSILFSSTLRLLLPQRVFVLTEQLSLPLFILKLSVSLSRDKLLGDRPTSNR